MDELMFSSPIELAELVRTGVVSARELVDCSLRRIEAIDEQVGAFIELDGERALTEASTIGPGDTRPFAGVPIAIKNNRGVKGLRLTHGAALLRDFIAPYDHAAVARLRRAGFVIVGTTKLPEFGILPVTEPALHGPTRNPWDLARTPGGSSGGAAAAVASGMVPVAHGNDGGGSLRIPAACCGLVGLKAQRHRVTTAPDLGASQLVVDGVLTRTVADTAALLDVLAGYESGDSAWAPPPAEPFRASAGRAPGSLRIAFTTLPPLPDAVVEARCAQAVLDAATLCESLGHAVEEVLPPWQSDDIDALFGAYFGAHVALSVQFAAALAAETGVPAPGQMEALSYELWLRATRLSAIEFQVLQTQLQARMRALIGFLERFDALLTPALAERPPALGELDGTAPDPGATFARAGYFTPFTPIFNASGQPAITIPLYHGDDGLPLAIQIAGRPAGEPTLLALAAQLETAAPWHARRPRLGSVLG